MIEFIKIMFMALGCLIIGISLGLFLIVVVSDKVTIVENPHITLDATKWECYKTKNVLIMHGDTPKKEAICSQYRMMK